MGESEPALERAREILQSVLTRHPAERLGYVREKFGAEPALVAEVERLLESFERVERELDASVGASFPARDPRAESPSIRIGKYEVLGRLGQGAMGVVYKARDPLMRRLVAIKTISSDIASDKDLPDRFYREAQSAGTLSHKNVITIYDLGEERGRPYIAMEFLAGEDLKSKLDRNAKLTLEQKLEWMIEMCEGLSHAHDKAIIHRDIKPGNIFVTREGEIKILDFGLARLTSSVATKTGSVMGTPSYMSPEQVRGEKVDHRSDLFSLGATFYELLTLHKPFGSDSIHGVFFKILETDPQPLVALDPWLPRELDRQLAVASEATAARAVASATMAMRKGDISLAQTELARAEEECPEYSEIPAIATQLARARTERIETLLARGKKALELGDPDASRRAATEILKLEPAHSEATEILRRVRKAPPRPAPAVATSERRPVLIVAGAAAAVAVAGVAGFFALRAPERPSEASLAATSSVGVSTVVASTSAPPVTVPVTSVPAPTTVVPSSSTSTVRETTSVPTSTTTLAPASTSSVATTSVAATSSVPVTSTVAPVLTPREQVLQLMERYERAYETLDVDLLGAVFPAVPIAVKNSFRNFRS